MALASLTASAMVLFRLAYTGSSRYAWMIVPNLLLAWIPMIAALFLERRGGLLRTALLGAVWLFFLPNAPYLVTDLVHLGREVHRTLVYFDAAMLTLFGFVGLYLGAASLQLVHRQVAARWGAWTGWAFAAGVTGLSSLGIYLGRVERWNSWDLVWAPHRIIQSALKVFSEPRVALFVLTMALLQIVMYIVFRETTSFAGSESED